MTGHRGAAFGLPTPEQDKRDQLVAAARAKGINPAPHPRTVTREVPLTVLVGGDGATQTVNHETDEPCYGCSCCALWARSLDSLAAAAKRHGDESHDRFVTHDDNPDCPICVLFMAGDELRRASTEVDGR